MNLNILYPVASIGQWKTARLTEGNFWRHFLDGVKETLSIWSHRSRARAVERSLLERSDHFLKDIGISRDTIYRDSRKFFWTV